MRTIDKPLVLLVDDDISHLRLTEVMLVREACHTVTAEHPREALEVLSSCTPDVIVLDVVMPGITGTELAERIRSIDRLREIPLIFVTSHVSGEVRSLSERDGVLGVLEKPLDMTRFRSLVASALKHPESEKRGRSSAGWWLNRLF